MNLIDLPQNVLRTIADNLDSRSKVYYSLTNKHVFQSVIHSLYAKIVYYDIDPGSTVQSNDHNRPKMKSVSIIDKFNVNAFFETISTPSCLNFSYSNLVIELYLERLDLEVFDLVGWRNSPYFPVFENLNIIQFPDNGVIQPLTFENAPNLTSLIIDKNFCDFIDFNKGSINFFNHKQITNLHIKGNLGKNEDMVIFKLVTTLPHMIKNLKVLHFLVDENNFDNYNTVYRRIVGFFAILRKMNLHMFNLSSLSLALTNFSSSTIISLISKHVIFENLIELCLFIFDDSKILTLIKPLDKLATIVEHHGFNIKELKLKYSLTKKDEEKNHLRSMMLLKLCESFQNLETFCIDLTMDGLNFSNLLMILGTPISNNIKTLKEVRINILKPSENLISNILPTLEDAMLLFPYLNFLNNCNCSICSSIMRKIDLNENSLYDETIKVSTLLMIGQELDVVQKDCSFSLNNCTLVNKFSKFLRNVRLYSKDGYLFDHLINDQLNHSLGYLPNLKYFEICGLIYKRSNGENINDPTKMDVEGEGQISQPRFELLYGAEFKGLDDSIISNITGLGQVFNGMF